jgi:hypothetical protein
MRAPAIIAVAITGSVPRKADNPAVPISIAEQIESTHEAYEAGASLVHVHVRNPTRRRRATPRSSPPSRTASAGSAPTSSCSSPPAAAAGRSISAARCCT